MTDFPDDADGEVLAELAALGIDLTQPLQIEFHVAVPDEETANTTCQALIDAGHESHVEYDDGEPTEADSFDADEDDDEVEPSWTVYVNKNMVPDYDEIVRIQAELDALARPLGGYCDGWGAFLDGVEDDEL